MIKYSFVYVSVLSKYSHLMLRNSACAKKTIARFCDDAITMVRWRDTNGAIEHRFIAIVLSHHRHRVIATLPSHCRNIASSSSHHRAIPSHHRHRVIAPSPSHCRTIALPYHHVLGQCNIAPSPSRHRSIDPKSMVDGTIVNCVALYPDSILSRTYRDTGYSTTILLTSIK